MPQTVRRDDVVMMLRAQRRHVIRQAEKQLNDEGMALMEKSAKALLLDAIEVEIHGTTPIEEYMG